MAQVIQTLCDFHLEDGFTIEGHTHEVSIDGVTRLVDACDRCNDEKLVVLKEFIARNGRKLEIPPRAAAPAPKQQRAQRMSPPLEGWVCPLQTCNRHTHQFPNRSGLKQHGEKVHGLTFDELMAGGK